MLDAADSTGGAKQLRADLARRRDAAELVAEEIRNALDHDDWSQAIDGLVEARRMGLSGSTLGEVRTRAIHVIADCVRTVLTDGRTDLAETIMARLIALGTDDPQVMEMERALGELRQARRLIDDGRGREAGQVLRRVAAILPRTDWLQQAIRICQTAAESAEALETGPLGLLTLSGGPTRAADGEQMADPKAPAVASPEHLTNPEPLPEKFRIQADGIGSFLVLRRNVVTIGPISSSQRPEVGLLADPNLPTVTIERVDEDYFLRSSTEVSVNDQPTTEKLLTDGDQIALSPRCRWRFLRPNAASTSAALGFSSRRLPDADTRKVILLDREIVIGPHRAAHISDTRSDQTVVLYMRGEHLLARSDAGAGPGADRTGPGKPLPMNTPVRIGSLSLVLTPG
jgi:hypothetical protein